MRVAAVVAMSRNGVIGRDGRLPWKLSSDLKLFRRLTIGRPVIMGRRTWDSLVRKPLPDRENIVVTRQRDFAPEGATIAHSLTEAVAAARGIAERDGVDEIAIIGGAQIFAEALERNVLDRIYLSEIDLTVDGDTVLAGAKPRGLARKRPGTHAERPG